MRDLLRKARTRVGVAVIGAGLLAVGGTATAAVVVSTPRTVEVADVEVTPVEPTEETTVAAPDMAEENPVVEPPVAPVAPAATTPAPRVEPVTEPAPQVPTEQPVQDQSGESYDPTAPWTDSAGQTYVPAPELPVEPLPGEPGYVPPAD